MFQNAQHIFIPQREGPTFTPIQIAGKYIVIKATYILITKINKITNNIIFIVEIIPTH
jgi:hypothetical protein